ncbi:MAG: hypothetical protein PSV18_10190 [Methylobacter sp.]|uniref:Uncharacterized protein n=1 Tax=Candidatus Methylobacter titanis TaxID=3053457 RepID=A0AA43TIJ8_9GAMM|nr:hypothetical protein [Candidatus Methylobacter titanis]MDI1293101.1 hypothetical protein [Candidatus Methylobacter titanis]
MKAATRFLLKLAALVMLSAQAHAGETFQVDLETVLKLAGADNLTVEETRLHYQQALAEQSKAGECAYKIRNPSGKCCLANFKYLEKSH